MKHIVLLLAAMILLPLGLAAQRTPAGGKPRFVITVYRGGKGLGTIGIELYPDIAPKHVRNFDSLVGIGFFDSTAFHRVIPGFMIQGGDPNSKNKPESTWGFGDPSQTTVPAEFTKLSHRRGIISAARASDPNSATSQFFICVGNPTQLDGNYSAYGHVISGMNVADSVVNSPRDTANNRPFEKVIMLIAPDDAFVGPPPAAPSLVSPADGTTHMDAAKSVTWDSVPGAIMYEVQFSRTPDFSTIDSSDFTPLRKTGLALVRQGAQRYYWRVRASDGGARGPFSQVRSFTTGLAAPALVAPLNNAKSVPVSAPLTWRPAGGASSYHLKISTLASFASSAIVLDREGIADTTYVAGGLARNTRYYWRVTGSDSVGDGPQSQTFFFTTTSESGVQTEEDASTFAVAGANPAHDRTSLRLLLPRASHIRLTLTDPSGGEVATIVDGTLPGGNHILPVDLHALPSGLYLCRLEWNGRSETRRLVVVR